MEFKRLLDAARNAGASDIHLTVGLPPYLRKEGDIGKVKYSDLTCESLIAMIYEVLDAEQKKRVENRKEVDLSVETERGFYRVNIAYQMGHPCVTARVVPDIIIPVENLGFPNEVWKDIIALERGLVLVTGVTGSGKSTTLASLIDRINDTDSRKIITIEDPIEYVHKTKKSLIWQREIGGDVESFPVGVKYAMRQDPDVILIGEIRDAETALAALSAAYSGHLVFSTLHTKDSVATIGRYIDFFPGEKKDDIARQLSENLEAILSQQLIPGTENGKRVLVMEVLRSTPAIRAHIANSTKKPIEGHIKSALQTGGQYKMITMDRHLIELVGQGRISFETAQRYAINKADIGDKGASHAALSAMSQH